MRTALKLDNLFFHMIMGSGGREAAASFFYKPDNHICSITLYE